MKELIRSLRDETIRQRLFGGVGNVATVTRLKEMIAEAARTGKFDRNPLLSKSHYVICGECRHRQKVLYLDYLKSGFFEIGKTNMVEVLEMQGQVGFMGLERVTPVVIGLDCLQCGNRIEAMPLSLEYLNMIMNRPDTSERMFA